MTNPSAGDGPISMSALHRHWLTFLIEGVVLVILGAIAVVVPTLATLALAILLGWLILASGVVGLITTLMMRSAPGFWWSLVSAILGIVVGVVLVGWPVGGAISLTIVVIAFFWIEGVATILFALDHRRELSGRWGWMLVSGIVDLILGAILIGGFPLSSTWGVGLLLGINMIFGGAALISMALHARSTEA
jgi:uncharacterized membrane protein HdeD (DUF308 family)